MTQRRPWPSQARALQRQRRILRRCALSGNRSQRSLRGRPQPRHRCKQRQGTQYPAIKTSQLLQRSTTLLLRRLASIARTRLSSHACCVSGRVAGRHFTPAGDSWRQLETRSAQHEDCKQASHRTGVSPSLASAFTPSSRLPESLQGLASTEAAADEAAGEATHAGGARPTCARR